MEDTGSGLQYYIDKLKPKVIIKGISKEPVQVLTIELMGDRVKIIGRGVNTNNVHDPVLTLEDLSQLEIGSEKFSFNGDPKLFRLGVEALRLGFAYEYDPYFSLSIARVDPLPHQLEAVYDYFLKLPRIKFLLADDPGAGKTIMAGLLLKELKIRGLVKRTLIVTPANLTFQWQREMKDKFREQFEIVRGEILRANYGSNPFIEKNQVVTSISWVSVVDDAKESLLRSHWDLIIVDEAHKMSAYSADHKTLAYQLGEELSKRTDHYLLMTATPHKGDPKNFCLFLELLDKDVYGDVKSLEEAMKRNSAPFYLRRIKESLVQFPDPDTGEVKKIFKDRDVQTIDFKIDDEEGEFYFALTNYVENQTIKAQADNSIRGRALSFIMAMLQRRFASSIHAVRESLIRMRNKRKKILENPEAYREEQILKKVPEDFDELPDDERQIIIDHLEEVVADIDPAALREEIIELDKLIDHAERLKEREVESKLKKLKEVITEHGIFKDPKMKLLIFTEHKDTLDYLIEKLEDWNLSVTKIHGGMRIGDRDQRGTRLCAEREFKEDVQIMVATEAAGEGINLQFCWFMINYDIPWNPVRLDQRMGRIHRYGQEHDCLILNFVATNTREGRVLQRLLDRLREIRKELGTDRVFNVVGEVFPANALEKMIREMYARRLDENQIKEKIVENIDPERFRAITESTLEGLAKRELNLSRLIGKRAEAKERRLVPEVIEDFFIQATPLMAINPKELKAKPHVYTIGRVPRTLWPIGERLESRFGRLGHNYKQIVFNKELLKDESTSEWVTPGHPLFEVVRERLFDISRDELQKGSVFYDLHSKNPYILDVFTGAIKDGRENYLNQGVFIAQSDLDKNVLIKKPTIFLDLTLAPQGTKVPEVENLISPQTTEQVLIEKELNKLLNEKIEQREREIKTISEHVNISLNEIINRVNVQFANLNQQKESGSTEPGLDGRISQFADRIEELNGRLEKRMDELAQEKLCRIKEIKHLGRVWVLPHPERDSPKIAPMVRDDEVEKIAIEKVKEFEKAKGWEVESVEAENRGFDLISRKPHPEDSKTTVDVKFIEVKGRAEIGEVALTTNEYKTAERLGNEYWLYVVYNCKTEPEVIPIQNPIKLGWEPLVKIEHYHVGAEKILGEKK